MKKLYFLLAFLVMTFVANAQTVNIHLKNGEVIKYNSEDVEFVDFTAIVSIDDELAKIKAAYIGGSIMQVNDLIKYGSKLNWSFINGSNLDVTLTGLQLINGKTNEVGNNLFSENVSVPAGKTVSYSITVGLLGIESPRVRFTFTYDGKEYTREAEYKSISF